MSKTKSGKHYLKDLIAQVINDYAEHVRPAKQLADYYGYERISSFRRQLIA